MTLVSFAMLALIAFAALHTPHLRRRYFFGAAFLAGAFSLSIEWYGVDTAAHPALLVADALAYVVLLFCAVVSVFRFVQFVLAIARGV